MNSEQILIISLRGFLQTGEKLMANLHDSTLAFEFLDNSNKIRKYIFDKFYHNSTLREYYKLLPKFQPETTSKVGESLLEQIANSGLKSKTLIEILGISISPDKEKQRDELMLLVSDINNKTRNVLQQLGGSSVDS